jgi:5S rRNA maturation endonuclease (ribonuclease M5)
MEIHDIHKLVLDEIYKMDGEKKMGADYIMVCCPFHGDTAPSLGIYTALGMEIPLGSFHCFGCNKKGGWNILARHAKLQEIEEWKIRDAGELSVGNLTQRFEQQKVYSSVSKLMKDLDRMAYIPWPTSEPWRGYDGKLIQDFGGLLLMNNFSAAYPVCFFPVMLSKDRIVGGVAAYLRKQMNGLSYINTRGEWTLESGLFQLNVARRLVFDHDLDYMCIVEGPRDVLATTCEGMPTVGALGANNFNSKKMEKIKNLGINTVYSIADNDGGGDKLRSNIKRACVDVGIRHVPIRLPKEYDDKGKLIKLDPDSLDAELWSDIKGFIKKNHDLVKVKKEYGWKRASV